MCISILKKHPTEASPKSGANVYCTVFKCVIVCVYFCVSERGSGNTPAVDSHF